jgi:holliday junction DNA helicase RuvA
MITLLRGTVLSLASQQLTVEVGGIGFAVGVPDERLYTLKQPVEVQVYFHWNQENGPQLYGFSSELAKTVFTLILSVSGIGPKIGLAVLAQINPEHFLQAIALADTKALSSVSGIGPKKAELMIMQLRDKAAKISPVQESSEGVVLIKIKEVSQALDSLNYSRSEISAALDFLKKNTSLESASFDELLRKALASLAKRV